LPDRSPPPSTPWPSNPPTAEERDTFAAAIARPFWLDRRADVRAHPALAEPLETDLCIVGGGFSGLWAALHAKRRDPGRRVTLVEGERIGSGASGRNGGFLSASITHGLENGLSRFPDEMRTLERLGMENFDGLKDDLARHRIECDFEETGELAVAVADHQVEELLESAELLRDYGHDVEVLEGESLRAANASPTKQAGVWDRTGAALVDPGKLCDGLARTIAELGVEVFEATPVGSLQDVGRSIELTTPAAPISARKVILATNAFTPLVRSLRRYLVPVYDYVLVSEPLDEDQLAAVGWRSRQGISDCGNQFHYYRLTDDDRILWGGFEAVYRYGGPVAARYDCDDETFGVLAQNFFATFPQLRGLRFTHKWGGAIDTCSRFSSFFDRSHAGRVVYVGGYTGLGVGSSRFGAQVALDLVDGRRTEATELDYVRRKPFPFPPEPLRWAVVQFTRRRLAAADRNGGRRGLWLWALDRLGLGFDS
jgi:glycine/D-amino acid oxidase-like deaminating enzyme